MKAFVSIRNLIHFSKIFGGPEKGRWAWEGVRRKYIILDILFIILFFSSKFLLLLLLVSFLILRLIDSQCGFSMSGCVCGLQASSSQMLAVGSTFVFVNVVSRVDPSLQFFSNSLKLISNLLVILCPNDGKSH